MKSHHPVLPMPGPNLFLSLICLAITIFTWGCAGQLKQLIIKETSVSFPSGSIISAKTGNTVSLDTLITDLETVQIIYIGESHTNPEHHQTQLKMLQTLHGYHPTLSVGMEMFDHTYQSILDEWSAGKLEEALFLRKVHWYANWRYDYALYRDILLFIKTHHIRLVGLNIPFHIPPKIAVGGIETLSDEEKKHLPKEIDTTDSAHREFVHTIFSHHSVPGRENFDHFYAAQCTWEDAMAEAIVDHLPSGPMVVLAGNGHIIKKFGIPNRTYNRSKAPYRTIYLAEADGVLEQSVADYIWVTPALTNRGIHPLSAAASDTK